VASTRIGDLVCTLFRVRGRTGLVCRSAARIRDLLTMRNGYADVDQGDASVAQVSACSRASHYSQLQSTLEPMLLTRCDKEDELRTIPCQHGPHLEQSSGQGSEPALLRRRIRVTAS